MAKTLNSLNDLADKLKDQNQGSRVQLINLAAEEELLKEENRLNKKIQKLIAAPYWLDPLFKEKSAPEFIDSIREVLLATQTLKFHLDKKKDEEPHYAERINAMTNTLASVSDVIKKIKVAATNNSLENLTKLSASISQLHANSKQVEKVVEKSTFKRLLGAIAAFVGWVSLAAGIATLNIGFAIIGGINICLGSSLLNASHKEKFASNITHGVNRFAGNICTLFQPPSTRVSDDNLQNDKPLYPHISVPCKA